MRACPLFELQKAQGAVFRPHAGFSVPAHYGDPDTECAVARKSCVVTDLSYCGKLSIRGEDRGAVLDRALVGDVTSLRAGCGLHTLALTPTGRILADMVIYALDDWHLVELDLENVPRVAGQLLQLDDDADVDVQDLSEAWGLLSLQGPESADALAYLGVGIPPPSCIRTAVLAGHPILVAERRRASAPGFDLFAAAGALIDCWNSILERGVLPAGLDALNALRIEAGIPWAGTELDEQVTPTEAGLEAALSSIKEGYIGHAAVVRARRRPPARRLYRLVIETELAPTPGAPVYVASRVVGKVTSAARCSAGGGAVALAFLKRDWNKDGAPVMVEVDGGKCPARVMHLPAMKG
jgi:aminomethyltransferase